MMYLSAHSQSGDTVRRRGLGREKFHLSNATGGWGPIWENFYFIPQSYLSLFSKSWRKSGKEREREKERILMTWKQKTMSKVSRPHVWNASPETGQAALLSSTQWAGGRTVVLWAKITAQFGLQPVLWLSLPHENQTSQPWVKHTDHTKGIQRQDSSKD